MPEHYHELLESYTKQGFRVIALAHRLVESQSINKLQKVQREDLEHELTFLGMYRILRLLNPTYYAPDISFPISDMEQVLSSWRTD